MQQLADRLVKKRALAPSSSHSDPFRDAMMARLNDNTECHRMRDQLITWIGQYGETNRLSAIELQKLYDDYGLRGKLYSPLTIIILKGPCLISSCDAPTAHSGKPSKLYQFRSGECRVRTRERSKRNSAIIR